MSCTCGEINSWDVVHDVDPLTLQLGSNEELGGQTKGPA